MTDATVTDLATARAAYDTAEKRPRKPRDGGGGAKPPPPPEPPDDDRPEWDHPKRLPANSPVQALGVDKRTFYFLNARGQFADLADKDITLNPIVGMFGGSEYLERRWPRWSKPSRTMPSEVIGFDNGEVRDMLISSCHDKGLWSPEDNVRGVGCWEEDAGGESLLVMHCGDFLFLSNGTKIKPGLRHKMLYPAAPPLLHPEPGAAGEGGAADVLLTKLKTWNWERGELDAKLMLGALQAQKLGAAPSWRPIAWLTGASGTGKSTLQTLIRWIHGDRGMVKSEDPTAAGIRQRVANRSITVSLDEVESEGKGNQTVNALIKLARIAASGGESTRGSPGGTAMSFIARNAFIFSSIVVPSMLQQDRNRMFIGTLNQVEWEGAKKKPREPGDDSDEIEIENENDSVLGPRSEWEAIGRQMNGRALAGWSRYHRTFRLYQKELEKAGHTARGQDQFGALGAAYDLAMFDTLERDNAIAWAEMLPASTLAETSGYSATHQNCLDHLLGAPIEAWKGGQKESVARLLRTAHDDLRGSSSNKSSSAEALEMHGIKLFRDRRDEKVFWIAVSHTHSALQRIFNGTDWSGVHGAPGAWAQMMGRINGAVTRNGKGNLLKLRFENRGQYCTNLNWESVFPPETEQDDDAEFVSAKDRS